MSKDGIKSETELFDYRDMPSPQNLSSNDDVIELLEEVEVLEEIDEELPYLPWSLFRDLIDRETPILEHNLIRQFIQRHKNSPIPSCLVNLDLKIKWVNFEFQKGLITTSVPLDHFLPELFRTGSDENLTETLLRDLQNPENAYSWKGRMHPVGETGGESFLRAMIQPLHCDRREIPLAYLVQWDVITPEYKKLLQNTFLSLLEASKMKDNDTGDHIERVNFYSRLLAENLKGNKGFEEIDNVFIDDISFLAAMHDVGKIGTPDDILNKAGPLDDWEREIMNEHTKNGAYILSTYPKAMAMEIARSHHEKWDGSGYPYGIFGDMIPLSARIVCVADVYDALRSKRSYKDAFDHQSSVDIMTKGRGTHFDPVILDKFIEINQQFNEIYVNNAD